MGFGWSFTSRSIWALDFNALISLPLNIWPVRFILK